MNGQMNGSLIGSMNRTSETRGIIRFFCSRTSEVRPLHLLSVPLGNSNCHAAVPTAKCDSYSFPWPVHVTRYEDDM